MAITGPETPKGCAPVAGPGSTGRAGLIATINDDRTGWAVLFLAVGLTALLQGGVASAGQSPSPILEALGLSMMFQWSFSVPVMAYLVCKGRLGWLAALYGVVLIGAAHWAAFATAVTVLQAVINTSGSILGAAGLAGVPYAAAGLTGAAVSFVGLQAFGRTLRTRRALVLMAAGTAALTVWGELAPAEPQQLLYAPWQLLFGGLILLLVRSRRATRLW